MSCQPLDWAYGRLLGLEVGGVYSLARRVGLETPPGLRGAAYTFCVAPPLPNARSPDHNCCIALVGTRFCGVELERHDVLSLTSDRPDSCPVPD